MNSKELHEKSKQLTEQLTDAGKLIEAGWVSFRAMTVPPDAGELQLRDMRATFFGGAHHLFNSIMMVMEKGQEPTDKDLERIGRIAQELDDFISEYEKKYLKTDGNA